MYIAKRIAGAAFILLAVLILVVGFGSGGDNASSQSVLDSPQASGQLLGTIFPVVLFGVIGLWLLLSKNQTN